jgi:hypothetical protein
MYKFISDSLDSQQVFEKIDRFYDGWFTARSINWKDFLEIFPSAFSWTKDEMFPAMLWVYYNYPIDYLATKSNNVPAIKNYRRSNLIRIACFLKSAKVENPINILKELTAGYANEGRNKLFKTDSDRLEYLNQALENEEIKGIEATLLNQEPYKSLLKDLIKRSNLKVLFTKKAIDLDKTLIPKLLEKFTIWEGGRLERPDKKEKVEKVAKKKGNLFDQLMMDMENQKVGVAQVVKEEIFVKPNITKKPFVPYREQIGFDIDPAVISDKIRQISGEKVPSNWENRASSVEDWAAAASSREASSIFASEQGSKASEDFEVDDLEKSDEAIEI